MDSAWARCDRVATRTAPRSRVFKTVRKGNLGDGLIGPVVDASPLARRQKAPVRSRLTGTAGRSAKADLVSWSSTGGRLSIARAARA